MSKINIRRFIVPSRPLSLLASSARSGNPFLIPPACVSLTLTFIFFTSQQVLALNQLTMHADAVLPLDNDRLAQISSKSAEAGGAAAGAGVNAVKGRRGSGGAGGSGGGGEKEECVFWCDADARCSHTLTHAHTHNHITQASTR